MDLFDYMRESQMKQEAPLASRLRPRTLDEIVGRTDLIERVRPDAGQGPHGAGGRGPEPR